MTTQNKVLLNQMRKVFKNVLKESDYRGYAQSRSGGCTACHGSGLVSMDSIPTNSYRDTGAGATGGKRKRKRKGGNYEMPVGVISVPKRYKGTAAGKSAGRKRTKKTKGGKRPLTKWMVHVMKIKKANPNLQLKDVLKKAKSSYKK